MIWGVIACIDIKPISGKMFDMLTQSVLKLPLKEVQYVCVIITGNNQNADSHKEFRITTFTMQIYEQWTRKFNWERNKIISVLFEGF